MEFHIEKHIQWDFMFFLLILSDRKSEVKGFNETFPFIIDILWEGKWGLNAIKLLK